MAQRLALCRTLLHEPRLLLLDEPYSALDDNASGLVDVLLSEVVGEKTVVVTSHDPERVRRFASQELALV
jgi:ABC-type bacteriocin/lantibiotic exporter with double-glycine peptidase domain